MLKYYILKLDGLCMVYVNHLYDVEIDVFDMQIDKLLLKDEDYEVTFF
jgi:hypothetical protein